MICSDSTVKVYALISLKTTKKTDVTENEVNE